MVQERRVPGGPELIPQAEGAEIDSAALTPQSAPFLASADGGSGDAQLAENMDVLYGEGALKDPEQAIKTHTAPTPGIAPSSLASGVTYKVAAGDTASSIAATFGVPLNTIMESNPSVNFSALVPGLSIVIPSQASTASFAG